jgi:hypothetical protein
MKTISLAIVVGTLVSGACFGQSAEESVVECTHVADKSARLRCYDDHMTRLGHAIASDAPVVSKPIAAEFGITPELQRKKRSGTSTDSQQSLVARVKAISARAHGELRIELDNDQVWVETQRPGNFEPPAVGDTVTVRHGTLGSYFLSAQSGPALRVERVR